MSDIVTVPVEFSAPEAPRRGLKFLKAWAIAQKAMGSAKKDKLNPHFGSNYPTMESVVDAISGPFESAGLVWLQEPFANLKSVGVVTYILHAESGEGTMCRLEYGVPPNAGPQVYGSIQSYTKRYGLQTAAGLPTAVGEDDDGNAAHGSPIKPPQPKPPPTQRPADGRHQTGVKLPAAGFKELSGMDLADVPMERLSGLVDYFTKAAGNPEKAKWKAQNEALMSAAVEEAMRRGGR